MLYFSENLQSRILDEICIYIAFDEFLSALF